ncbi:FxsA family protein [Oceanisphaera pacifica]|uniref:FxsA family protein n=1 Tax=Oceanisphaera pacifica TaxID=2818389 RepID=UPI001FB0F904|nr:FxsA family protein [Oceanisphaera pacifica]
MNITIRKFENHVICPHISDFTQKRATVAQDEVLVGKVFLLFVAATLMEIFVFIEVGSEIGALSTVALIVLTAVVGISLVRIQGFQTLMEAQRKINVGETPAREMLSGMMLALSGLLLLLPGFVSDIGGILLLLPPIRNLLVERFISRVNVQGSNSHQGHTFDGHYQRTDNNEQQARLDEYLKKSQDDDGTTFEGDFQRKDDK